MRPGFGSVLERYAALLDTIDVCQQLTTLNSACKFAVSQTS